jgi:hypothetical protein
MALSSEGSQPAPSQASSKAPKFAVLVFTKTTGFRHKSMQTPPDLMVKFQCIDIAGVIL